MSAAQREQTKKSFDDKWVQNPELAFRETLREGSEIQRWILNRNGWASLQDLRVFLQDKKRVLDAGCGNGRVTALLRACSSPEKTEIVGIDLVAADVARANLAEEKGVRILPADLLGDLSGLGCFDFIYCQEVLHHTSDPERAFRNLVERCLAPGGQIAIYVYKKKAPLREFSDDYVRGAISGQPYERAMEVSRALANFGRALATVHVEVDVPEIDVLGIPAGRYDIQRLIYNFMLKCFWNESLSFDENAAINYDWFHPQLCARYEPAEIEEWFARAGLTVLHRVVDPYGITMRGQV